MCAHRIDCRNYALLTGVLVSAAVGLTCRSSSISSRSSTTGRHSDEMSRRAPKSCTRYYPACFHAIFGSACLPCYNVSVVAVVHLTAIRGVS